MHVTGFGDSDAAPMTAGQSSVPSSNYGDIPPSTYAADSSMESLDCLQDINFFAPQQSSPMPDYSDLNQAATQMQVRLHPCFSRMQCAHLHLIGAAVHLAMQSWEECCSCCGAGDFCSRPGGHGLGPGGCSKQGHDCISGGGGSRAAVLRWSVPGLGVHRRGALHTVSMPHLTAANLAFAGVHSGGL